MLRLRVTECGRSVSLKVGAAFTHKLVKIEVDKVVDNHLNFILLKRAKQSNLTPTHKIDFFFLVFLSLTISVLRSKESID